MFSQSCLVIATLLFWFGSFFGFEEYIPCQIRNDGSTVVELEW